MSDGAAGDTVSVRDLRVSTVIGVHDWEREVEQTLTFAIDMAVDVARAAARDDVADAVDYSAVAATVTTVVREGKFQLIETATARVAERILASFPVGWVRVEVAKPIAAAAETGSYTAVIAIERGQRQDSVESMVRIGTIVWHVRDAERATEFWTRALGYVPRDPESDVLVPAAGAAGPGIVMDESDKTHIDLYTDSRAEQLAEVERLVSLGATRVEWTYPDHADFIVLTDTEGNVFCVINKGAD